LKIILLTTAQIFHTFGTVAGEPDDITRQLFGNVSIGRLNPRAKAAIQKALRRYQT
jgi:hypothetical protein